jgi:hypothetical protein
MRAETCVLKRVKLFRIMRLAIESDFLFLTLHLIKFVYHSHENYF